VRVREDMADVQRPADRRRRRVDREHRGPISRCHEPVDPGLLPPRGPLVLKAGKRRSLGHARRGLGHSVTVWRPPAPRPQVSSRVGPQGESNCRTCATASWPGSAEANSRCPNACRHREKMPRERSRRTPGESGAMLATSTNPTSSRAYSMPPARSSDGTPSRRSMIGFAARPGTEVDPMCSQQNPPASGSRRVAPASRRGSRPRSASPDRIPRAGERRAGRTGPRPRVRRQHHVRYLSAITYGQFRRPFSGQLLRCEFLAQLGRVRLSCLADSHGRMPIC
jgi:hypothetical protein